MLLVFSHEVVGVHQLYRFVAIGAVDEGSFVTGNVLFCESLEYLLEGRFPDIVFFNAKVYLFFLYQAKKSPNPHLLFGKAQLKILAAMLENLDLLKTAS